MERIFFKTTPGNVYKYLLENPDFLERIVLNKVSVERLDSWIRVAEQKTRETAFLSGNVLNEEKFTEDPAKLFYQMKCLRSRFSYPPSVPHINMEDFTDREWEKLIPNIDNYLFPFFDIKEADINPVIVYFFDDLFGHDGYNRPHLIRFLAVVQSSYFPQCYHNYHHALSHLQTMYWILKNNSIAFSQLEKMVLMVASICHDVGHPGLNQEFLLHIFSTDFYSSPLLERHHTQTTYTIMMIEDSNIFYDVSLVDFQTVLDDIEECILATFPNEYRQKLELITSLVNKGFDFKDKECQSQAKCLLMIICDLCATWKNWKDHVFATWCLYKEFSYQGEMQMKLGLPTMDLMKREILESSPDKMQISFIRGCALPFFEQAAKIFPCMEQAVLSTKVNLNKWLAISQSDETTK